MTEDVDGTIHEASKFKNPLNAVAEMRQVIKVLNYLDAWVRGDEANAAVTPEESQLTKLKKSVDDIIEYVKSEMEKEKAYYAKQRSSK